MIINKANEISKSNIKATHNLDDTSIDGTT